MKAQTKASMNYNQKTYERVEFIVLKGDKAKIRAYAKEHGISSNELIRTSISAYTGLDLPTVNDKRDK